jgi:tRNA (mo5U34)-methyltransferase
MMIEQNRTEQSLREELKNLKGIWHSPIDLGYGVITAGKKTQRRFARRLKLMQIPKDMTNMRVLDIGTWDGFFAFEFERRGANVLAIDNWNDDKQFSTFLFAKKQLNSKVEYRKMDAHDVDPNLIGKFDIVFFAGMLYHLRHPLKVLEGIRSVTDGYLILETVMMVPCIHENFPMMAFFPGDEEANASGRRWGICGAATVSWLKEALNSAGFARVEVKYASSFRWLNKIIALLTNKPQGRRVILHAFTK